MNAALLLLSCIAFATQARPPRDAPATPSTGTAIVRGRITAATTGEPLHRVRVTLNTPNPNPPTAVTDTRGDYEITGVAAGSYSITAARGGYLTLQYGQRRPREAGRTLDIRAGQVLEGIDMALPRGGVLAGVVTDDTNDQYPGVRVEALEFRYTRGRRVLLQAASATTNDLGQFRLSGLPPGTYYLRASTTDTWDADDGTATHAYATTYYPGVTGSDQAQSLNVTIGQEVNGVDFSLRPGRTARIHGVAQNAAGEPIPSQAISLSPAIRGVGGVLFATGGPASTSSRTDRNGAFDFPNLPPGEYVVSSTGDADRVGVSVTVADGDVRSVVLTPRKPGSLTGSVITDTGTPATFPPAGLRVLPVPGSPESLLPSFTGPSQTSVGRDWTFRWTNIDGQYLFRITGLPDSWMLGAVLLNGRVITDTPLDVPAGGVETKGLQIVLTQTGAKVIGDVVTPDGRPAPDSTVVVFSANPARWTPASRFIKAARPDNAGRFSVSGLPPGAYHAVARDFVADGQWEDRAFLNGLVPSAVRFDLGEGGSESVTLKLEPPR